MAGTSSARRPRPKPLRTFLRNWFMPRAGASFWDSTWFIMRRGACLGAIYLFWYMVNFDLVGPPLRGIARDLYAAGGLGGLFSGALTHVGAIFACTIIGLTIPYNESFGLKDARAKERKIERLEGERRTAWGLRARWLLCAGLTFLGHMFFVVSANLHDRTTLETAVEQAASVRAAGDAAVSTEELRTQLAEHRDSVRRAQDEVDRLAAWRTPLARAVASRDYSADLFAIQVELSARRQARGEAPLEREDGLAAGSSQCEGLCGETAEAIEREIELASSTLADAAAERDRVTAIIKEREDAEAGGRRTAAIIEAAEIENVDTTTARMRAFIDTGVRLVGMAGVNIDRENVDRDEQAANAADLVFFILLAMLNIIAWGNNEDDDEDDDEGPALQIEATPMPAPPGPAVTVGVTGYRPKPESEDAPPEPRRDDPRVDDLITSVSSLTRSVEKVSQDIHDERESREAGARDQTGFSPHPPPAPAKPGNDPAAALARARERNRRLRASRED